MEYNRIKKMTIQGKSLAPSINILYNNRTKIKKGHDVIVKRMFSITLAFLLLTACGPSTPARPGENSSDQSYEEMEATTSGSLSDFPSGSHGDGFNQEDSLPPVSVPNIQFQSFVDDDSQEYAIITAYDPDGNTVWEYQTPKLASTELQRIEEIGIIEDGYFFNCGGSVICLDAGTGDVRWENPDFGGASISYAVDSNTIYLCGYYGPDFYAISTTGETLSRIQNFDSDYWWPHTLELNGDHAVVTLYQGPDGQPETGYRFRVNLHDWTYEMI